MHNLLFPELMSRRDVPPVVVDTAAPVMAIVKQREISYLLEKLSSLKGSMRRRLSVTWDEFSAVRVAHAADCGEVLPTFPRPVPETVQGRTWILGG